MHDNQEMDHYQKTDPSYSRHIFCNRTLNLKQVKVIGYDMDYTLIHYRVEEWERKAYQYAKSKLLQTGWPVEDLHFDVQRMARGLILDTQLGNILKVNSFGYVKHALHGTRSLDYEIQRRVYSNMVVSLAESRFVFLNTLFSLSEACLFAQLVDLMDDARLPHVASYSEVYEKVRMCLDEAHVEGQLKSDIIADPDRFVELDADASLALLDQRHAGKKLLLITNSDWHYTRHLMSYAFDRYMPKGQTFRDIFHCILVSARKPDFFSRRAPLFEVVGEEGLLRLCKEGLSEGGLFWGGDATWVEQSLGVSGDEILYVGDHIYGDVNVSKRLLKWRTALVLRELEDDLKALIGFSQEQQFLESYMLEKAELEQQICQLRLQLQRKRYNYGIQPENGLQGVQEILNQYRQQLQQLDDKIRPLAEIASRLANVNWGPLMRAGNDKSHLARQVERYADIYMSRVSNFLYHTPFVYLRSMRTSLPHDPSSIIVPERISEARLDGL